MHILNSYFHGLYATIGKLRPLSFKEQLHLKLPSQPARDWPVIRNNTHSQAVSVGQQTQPGAFHGMVSWRECLLFLGKEAVKSMQWRFGYSMTLHSIFGHHSLLFRIPYTGTEFTSNEVWRSQTRGHHGSSPNKLIKALYRLRETASTHSPRLVHLLHTQQDENDMVPTGFITYVLMTWCPGSLVSDVTWFSMPLAEKYAVREAFKKAWE